MSDRKSSWIGLFLGIIVLGTVAATLPILNGLLQSDLNGNGHSLTNLSRLSTSGVTNLGLTGSRAMVTDGQNAEASSSVTATEIGYVSGVSSAIQAQLDGKLASGNAITQAHSVAVTFKSTLHVTNGVGSLRSNLVAPTSFTFPSSTVNWTNPISTSILVYIDNSGVSGAEVKMNGTQIYAGLTSTRLVIGLQPGEYFSETYSSGTPSGRWHPFP